MAYQADSGVSKAWVRLAKLGSLAGIAWGLLVIGSGGLLIRKLVNQADADAHFVARAQAMSAAAETVETHFLDMEAAANSFAATGDAGFLQTFSRLRLAVGVDLNRLRSLAGEDAQRLQRQQPLGEQVDASLEPFDRLVAERQRTRRVPRAALFKEAGRRVDAMQATLRDIEAAEQKLIDAHDAQRDAARRWTKSLTRSGTLAGLALVMIAGLLTHRQFIRNFRVDRLVQARFAGLKHRVEEDTFRLQQSQQQLENIIGSAMDGIITVDEEQRIVLFNASAEEMFGCDAAHALGQPLEHFIPPRFRENHAAHVQQFGQTGATKRSMGALGSLWALRSDGREFQIEASISQTTAAGKKLFTVILRNVTDRLQAERSLREQAQLLDLAPVLVRDLENRIVLWTRGAEELYGIPASQAMGKISHELFATRFPRPLGEIEKELMETGRWSGELLHRKADGSTITVASVWVLDHDAQGKPARILVASSDITERKRAEERLAAQAEALLADKREIRKLNDELEQRVQQRTAQLEAANKELEAFTYSVSHDLRAPLRHISGFSKILTEEFGPRLPREAQRHLERIQDGTRRMGQLVDELLNLARVGRHSVARQGTELSALVEEVVTLLKPEFAERRVEWQIGKLPYVECDAVLMRQVFQNLLANALKFTRPRPQAVIEIGHRQENGDATVYVRDNGVGFNMKYVDKLFGVFQRLHRAEDFEGTGIGLATVQRIIQKHGGRVWAEAEPDKGATFFFTLGEAEPAVNVNAGAAGEP